MNQAGWRFGKQRIAALVLCAATLASLPVQAAPLPFDGSPYSYYANDTPIAKMLTEYLATLMGYLGDHASVMGVILPDLGKLAR